MLFKKEKIEREKNLERNIQEIRLEYETHFEECENIRNKLINEMDELRENNQRIIIESEKKSEYLLEKERQLKISNEKLNELEYYQKSHQKLYELETSYEKIQLM